MNAAADPRTDLEWLAVKASVICRMLALSSTGLASVQLERDESVPNET